MIHHGRRAPQMALYYDKIEGLDKRLINIDTTMLSREDNPYATIRDVCFTLYFYPYRHVINFCGDQPVISKILNTANISLKAISCFLARKR